MNLVPHIVQRFDLPVWRMEIDEENDIICLEMRNAADKKTSFSSVDLSSGKVYFKELTLAMGWQCSLTAAFNGVMLVNGYRSEILPVSKGLTALDSKSGEQLWANYNLNLQDIHPLGFKVYDTRIQPKQTTLFSARTGTAIPEHEKDSLTFSAIKYPYQVNAVTLQGIKGLPKAADPNMPFIEHNKYRIVSLHSLSSGLYKQHLFILNSGDDVVFEDIIIRDIQKLQPEAFIVYKDKLIWLQNRSVLKVLDL